jgi:hypothetical protein
MRTNNLFRSVLALGAVLAVAGPGLVLAGEPAYTPKILQVLGPSSVPVTTSANYDAKVTFTDNSTATFTGATTGLSWSAARGTIDADGNYTAPAGSGRDSVKGVYTNNGITVTGTRIIQNP